jgi:hypothetical protein
MIFALALTIILGGLAIWTWSEFSVFRSDAETIVSATALTMDDIARNSLDRVDGVLETVVGRIEEKGIDNINSEAERGRPKAVDEAPSRDRDDRAGQQ